MPGPMDNPQAAAAMIQAAQQFRGRAGGVDEGKNYYTQWQKLMSELEAMKGNEISDPTPQVRVNPNTGQNEYAFGGRFANSRQWEDQGFQENVYAPWAAKERERMTSEQQKRMADLAAQAAAAEFEYNQWQQARQNPQEAGAGSMGSRRNPRAGAAMLQSARQRGY